MKNITNKTLLRMKELMGNVNSLNESNSISSTELIKKTNNGSFYGIVRENKKYYIKESNDGVNFDFIGGVANKTKNQFESFEQAVKRLNLMLEDTNVLQPDIVEEKRFVLKTKKSKPQEPKLDFGTEDKGEDIGFDFGAEDKGGEESTEFDFGTEDKGGEESTEFDFGDETEVSDTDKKDTENTEDLDVDIDVEDDDPIKSIQKMTGKLGQKIRDTEDLSSDTMKWVAKSVLSALDIESMDSDDKKDLIRTIKKKEQKGSDDEFDFMDDPNDNEDDDWFPDQSFMADDEETEEDYDICTHCGGLGYDDFTGEVCEWCDGDGIEPTLGVKHEEEEEEDYMDGGDICPACHGIGKMRRKIGFGSSESGSCPECEGSGRVKSFTGNQPEIDSEDEISEPYIDSLSYESNSTIPNNRFKYTYREKMNFPFQMGGEDYMEDEEEMYGPGNISVDKGEEIIEVNVHSLINKFKSGGFDEVYSDKILDYVNNKLKNKGTNNGQTIVTNDFVVRLDNKGFSVTVPGEKRKYFDFDKIGAMTNYLNSLGKSTDYMGDDEYPFPIEVDKKNKFNDIFVNDEIVMNPKTAPARPTTKPGVKPGTDRPSPSKRPFTPPPHIKPGDEPAPKARRPKL